MTIKEHNALVEKAKTRKDGVYKRGSYYYVIKNNAFRAYADFFGNVRSVHGGFHYKVGKINAYERKEKLTEYLKKL